MSESDEIGRCKSVRNVRRFYRTSDFGRHFGHLFGFKAFGAGNVAVDILFRLTTNLRCIGGELLWT